MSGEAIQWVLVVSVKWQTPTQDEVVISSCQLILLTVRYFPHLQSVQDKMNTYGSIIITFKLEGVDVIVNQTPLI